MCLFNMPEVKVLYGGQKCGNGYVEEGEQCDCGDLEVRRSSCVCVLIFENIFHQDIYMFPLSAAIFTLSSESCIISSRSVQI